jgi:hypothetical protein
MSNQCRSADYYSSMPPSAPWPSMTSSSHSLHTASASGSTQYSQARSIPRLRTMLHGTMLPPASSSTPLLRPCSPTHPRLVPPSASSYSHHSRQPQPHAEHSDQSGSGSSSHLRSHVSTSRPASPTSTMPQNSRTLPRMTLPGPYSYASCSSPRYSEFPTNRTAPYGEPRSYPDPPPPTTYPASSGSSPSQSIGPSAAGLNENNAPQEDGDSMKAKRQEQNRKAQRALRQRRDEWVFFLLSSQRRLATNLFSFGFYRHVKDLENRTYAAIADAEEMNHRWQECRFRMEVLQHENKELRVQIDCLLLENARQKVQLEDMERLPVEASSSSKYSEVRYRPYVRRSLRTSLIC